MNLAPLHRHEAGDQKTLNACIMKDQGDHLERSEPWFR